MGLKLEIGLVILIITILVASFTVKITNNISVEESATKELEFTDTVFIEADTHKMQGKAFSRYGVRNAGVLTVHHLRYHTDNIESLTAKRGIYKGSKIYLDNDIVLKQKEGFDYNAEHAVYDTKTEILNITSNFTALMNKNIIHGYTLQYDTRKKEAFAKNIDAVVYTVEK